VVGVGMTKFEKPGRREGWDYPQMARESGTNALRDAGIDFDQVQAAYVGYVYGEVHVRAARGLRVGHDRHPGGQREHNCATGSRRCTWRESIRGGRADCALALASRR